MMELPTAATVSAPLGWAESSLFTSGSCHFCMQMLACSFFFSAGMDICSLNAGYCSQVSDTLHSVALYPDTIQADPGLRSQDVHLTQKALPVLKYTGVVAAFWVNNCVRHRS